MAEGDYVVVQDAAKHTTAGQWHEVTLGDICSKIDSLVTRGFRIGTGE